MVKKTEKKKFTPINNPVTESAREIWLAGLGAFSMAQKESGKAFEQSVKLFDKLVEEGTQLEDKTRKAAEDVVVDIRDDMEERFDTARKQATENWDKLEEVFEERVSRALDRLGVPTAGDVQDLLARVQELAGKVRDTAREVINPEEKVSKPVKKAAAKATKKAKPVARKAKATTRKAAKKVTSKAKTVAKEVKAKTAA